MNSIVSVSRLGTVVGLTLTFGIAVECQSAKCSENPLPQTLASVLQRIHDQAAREEWMQLGWDDETIDGWVNNAVGVVAKTTNSRPMRIPNISSGLTASRPKPTFEKAYTYGGNMDLLFPKDSVILSDGDVTIVRAEDCVVIARGVITLGTSKRCVIVSGCYIYVQSDGGPGDEMDASILISPGWATLGATQGTRIIALRGVQIGQPMSAVLINTRLPNIVPPFNADRIMCLTANLPIGEVSSHPIGKKIALLGMITVNKTMDPLSLRKGPGGVVFKYEDRRYIADVGRMIVDEQGQPVKSLQGWKLRFARGVVAIFRNGDDEALATYDADEQK